MLLRVLLFALICITAFSKCTTDRRFGRESSMEMPRHSERYESARVENISEKIIEGISSYYGPKFHGRQTANGEIFDMYGLTAAHKSLPFGTVIHVENLENGKQVTVTINDRGPFVPGRILDLSFGAAKKLDMINSGTAKVRIRILQLGKE